MILLRKCRALERLSAKIEADDGLALAERKFFFLSIKSKLKILQFIIFRFVSDTNGDITKKEKNRSHFRKSLP